MSDPPAKRLPQPSWQQTRELVEAARAGSREPLRALLERYRPKLLVRIRLMMGRAAAAYAETQDLAQQVMLEALQGMDRFEMRDEDALLSWLTRIARNNIRDDARRRRERVFAAFSQSQIGALEPEQSATPSCAAAAKEAVERVADALVRLSEDHQRVIELRHFERLPFRAIAARLGRSEEAVERLHARALVQLGGALRPGAEGRRPR